MKPTRADSDDVRNLAYLALTENDQIFYESWICEMRRVGILRGVSSILCFRKGAWSCLCQNIDVKARHSSFLRLVVVL